MNQAELRAQARERTLDADALIKGGRWSFAYYVVGYAVECALKSCLLARMIHTGWVYEEKAKINECLTHDFGELIKLSGMTDELNAKLAANPTFVGNWGITTRWKVTDRYGQNTEAEAKALYAAITDDPDGVLMWIMNFW